MSYSGVFYPSFSFVYSISIIPDNVTWNSAVKARNQSYKGSLSLEMEVIIESAKGHHVQLDDRLGRTISSIDQVVIVTMGTVIVRNNSYHGKFNNT